MKTRTSTVGLIAGICVVSLIVVVAVASSSLYCVVKMKRRSVSSSAKGNNNKTAMEELDINITHNSAYGLVEESQLAQDGGVVYEEIKDNCLYEIQANLSYGPLQHKTPCYENPDEVTSRNPTHLMSDV